MAHFLKKDVDPSTNWAATTAPICLVINSFIKPTFGKFQVKFLASYVPG